MYRYQSRLLPLPVWMTAGILLFSASHLYGQNARADIIHSGIPPYVLGDIVPLTIQITAGNERVTGMEFYLTLDPTYFKPVLNQAGQPFDVGDFLNVDAFDNDMHGDSLHLGPDGNGLDDWQLDFVQLTSPGPNRDYGTGTGTAATFYVEIVGLPPAGAPVPTMQFEDKIYQGRQTGYYYILGLKSTRGGFSNFPCTAEIPIAGLAISPAIRDTVLVPDADLNLYLGDYFNSNIVDSSAAIWTEQIVSPVSLPAGASFSITPAGPSPSSRLILNTSSSNHFILDANIFLEGTYPGPPPMTFYDQQPLRIIVDHLPVFDVALPPFTFDEDVPLPYLANADAGGVLFSDQDDFDANLTFWLDPDENVHLSYDDANTVTFYADTNWYGTQEARLYVQDGLGMTIDTLLTFTVNPINDPPVVNFDAASALGDTLVIHRATRDTVDLGAFVTDVDDAALTWTINSSVPAYLDTTFLASDQLELLADSISPFVDIDMIFTVEDGSGAQDSDTLVVSIRSWPPVITILDDIKMVAGTDTTIQLDDWVVDNDTPDNLMTWTFQILDTSGVVDNLANAAFDPATHSVTVSVDTGHSAVDYLIMTVTDDNNNSTTDTTRLFIFESLAPMIAPFPTLTIYWKITDTTLIDLDDYVADLTDDPEDIIWTHYSGGDSLLAVSLNSFTHELSVSTSSTFIGYDTLTFIARNSLGYQDTSDMVLRVVRRVDGPPIWRSLPDQVEVVYDWTTDLLTYGQVCIDETPTLQIDFVKIYDSDSLVVTEVPPDSVKLTAPRPDEIYTTTIAFSAEDELGQVSFSDTVTVLVKDSFSPWWDPLPVISLAVNGTRTGLFLDNYLHDKDTPFSSLDVQITYNTSFMTVSYNTLTSEITIQAADSESNSYVTFTATDPKGNTATIRMYVKIAPITDDTPPRGELSYFFNPVSDRWIHYVVVADSTALKDRFEYDYFYSPPLREDRTLNFTLTDDLPGTLAWTAPYHFKVEANYTLSVELTDGFNLLLPKPSLNLQISFAKRTGGDLTSPDGMLRVSYPPLQAGEDGLILISEETMWEPEQTATLGKQDEQTPSKVYALDTNLPESLLATLTYFQDAGANPYYSFYKVAGDELEPMDTYTDSEGRFVSMVPLGEAVVFGRSDTPARRAPLPVEQLLCHPNPFNATIQIRFVLPVEDRGRIVIYNLLGQEVFPTPLEHMSPGMHTFSWHGRDDRGLQAPSGIYFIRLDTELGRALTRKVTMLK
ncbi:MAG: T9SS type A sorting domain-containing protein [Fidelibacterota bacterium]|nr:MAG: T9SS type A sorting domain-containing protein [Candidatus Neomarinimicrobiota bacterium]